MSKNSIPLQVEKENGKDAVVNRELFESIRKRDHLRYIEQDEAIKVLRKDLEIAKMAIKLAVMEQVNCLSDTELVSQELWMSAKEVLYKQEERLKS